MMVGHANYPALDDSGFPSSLSCKIIQGILRGEWNYRGAVISDDLDMGAIVGHYGLAESVTRAVEAGNDLVLLCHRPELIPEAAKALETISPARAAEAEKQIAQLRVKFDPPLPFSVEAHAAIDRKIYQLRVDTLGAEAAAGPLGRRWQAVARRDVLKFQSVFPFRHPERSEARRLADQWYDPSAAEGPCDFFQEMIVAEGLCFKPSLTALRHRQLAAAFHSALRPCGSFDFGHR